MSPSAAHDVIRNHHGRGSSADLKVCYLFANGRHADIIAMAAAILAARRPGRILSIAS